MARKTARRVLLAALALGATPGAATTVMEEMRVAGWIERVRLGEEGVVLSAKLDTGADNSSLHAPDVRWFTRDGSHWVAFEVTGEDGRKVHFERRVIRITEIKSRRGGKAHERPTVLMGVCLGRAYRITEVNLADRTRFKQPFLVGRSFLANNQILVNSEITNTVEPDCAKLKLR
ncbi:MAG: RimK/LysX family protein [Betaproteobacteria bacterium]|nr:RimK/LysX family protein [Betaproteobacteria bacterium]MDH3435810.1 RimK/LysX family protein [Betaproteobacteria bacterium]